MLSIQGIKKLHSNMRKNLDSFMFWIIISVLSGCFAFLIVKSFSLSILIILLLLALPLIWRSISDQKYILILILLSILPGMLGRFSTGPKTGTAILLTDLLVVVLVFGFFFKTIFHNKKLVKTPLHNAILIFFSIAVLSFFNGIFHLYNLGNIELKEIVVSLMYLLRWFGYALIYFVLCDEIKDIQNIKYWFKWLNWILFFTAIFGFLQLIFILTFLKCL